MKSTVKVIILGVALSLTGCGQLSGSDIAKLLKASTVLVKTDGGHGTAFFVRGKSGVCTLVTAAHVVRDKSVVRLQTSDGKEREPQEIIPFEQDLDLAVMTFAPREGGPCAYPPLKLGNSETVEELAPIYVSGFPGRDGGEPSRQTIQTVVTGLDNLPQGYSISYTGELHGGMSGGPVLDRWGKVVAVHGLSDRRLVELYDAERQASLLPQELATVRQAEERVRSGVLVNTFKWGIPINLYLRNRPAMVVPDGAGISSTFAWLLFGGGAVAGGLLVYFYFGVQPLTGSGGRQYATRLVCGFLIAGVFAAGAVLMVNFSGLPRLESITRKVKEVELKSARGVDYQKLRDLLAAKDWQEADEETGRVMVVASGREKEGWLGEEDIDNFPCEDLRTIDQLWLKYSDGRFGFSVQKDIYQELGGTREYDRKILEAFGDRVGWRQGGDWLSYSKLNNCTELIGGVTPWPPPSSVYGLGWFSSLAQRLVTCSL